jgi:arsenate reductase (thioredoxin)
MSGAPGVPRTVLFVCVENACRSLMAEAMFNADPPAGWVAVSAGTRPASKPHPRTERMLEELGLALPRHPPQPLTRELVEQARIAITLGCLDDASCPAYLHPSGTRDWGLPDPASLDEAGFRDVRDRLATLVQRLQEELAGAADGPAAAHRHPSA